MVLRTGQRGQVCGRLRNLRCGHLNLPSPALVVAPALKVKPSEDAPSRGAHSPCRQRIGRLGGRWSAVPASSPTRSMLERPCRPKAKRRLRGRVATRQTGRRRRALQASVCSWPGRLACWVLCRVSRSNSDAKVNNEEGRDRRWYETRRSRTKRTETRSGIRRNKILPTTPEGVPPESFHVGVGVQQGRRGKNRKCHERKKRWGQRHRKVRSHGLLDLLS